MSRSFYLVLIFAFSLFPSHADQVPKDLLLTRFSGPEITPSPACICASEDGSVYVGVDLNGSLGKGPEKGASSN